MRESDVHLAIEAQSRVQAESGGAAHVLIGPGDDCAVIAPHAGELLLTVDHLIEGRHYLGPWYGPVMADAAYKAIARSISDLAAMAGTPSWALVTAAFPPRTSPQHAAALSAAIFAAAKQLKCPVVGGDVAVLDVVAGEGGGVTEGAAAADDAARRVPLVLTCTVGGHAHPERGPVLRSGARSGDVVFVTGALGGSLASGRHLRPPVRVAAARALADFLGTALTAMIDISDGLGRDGARLARASSAHAPVRMVIDPTRLPLHPDAGPWQQAIADGEDYELLFCVDAGAADKLPGTIAGTAIARIGLMQPSSVAENMRDGFCHAALQASLPGGPLLRLDEAGFDHATDA